MLHALGHSFEHDTTRIFQIAPMSPKTTPEEKANSEAHEDLREISNQDGLISREDVIRDICWGAEELVDDIELPAYDPDRNSFWYLASV